MARTAQQATSTPPQANQAARVATAQAAQAASPLVAAPQARPATPRAEQPAPAAAAPAEPAPAAGAFPSPAGPPDSTGAQTVAQVPGRQQTEPAAQAKPSAEEAPAAAAAPAESAAQPAPAPAGIPEYRVLRIREEERTKATPITYREYVYAVDTRTERREAEQLLMARFNEVRGAISELPRGKLVQLAVFDHAFKERPARPPIATLVWKDWRGEPVVQFPLQRRPSDEQAPAPPEPQRGGGPEPAAPTDARVAAEAAVPTSGKGAAATRPLESQPGREAGQAAAAEAKPTPAPTAAAPGPPPAAEPVAAQPEARAREPAKKPTKPAKKAKGRPEPAKGALDPAAWGLGSARDAGGPAIERSSPRAEAPKAAARPDAARARQPAESAGPAKAVKAARPAVKQPTAPVQPAPAKQAGPAPAEAEQVSEPRRVSAGDDLISDLFETMHELHFMADMPSGAGFVVNVIQETFSCKAGLVHVFDIDTSHFVVVRAFGPGAREVLLHRTSDREPWMVEMMQQGSARRVDISPEDAAFTGGRWEALRLKPTHALCGPVHLSGRYLGAIELVDPKDGGKFHEVEVNALDYICEQFADFLSQRPIVVDADLILQEQP